MTALISETWKDQKRFPVKENLIYLNNCGVAPLPEDSYLAGKGFLEQQARSGMLVFQHYPNPVEPLRQEAAKLFDVSMQNVSFVKNTAEAIGMIANGYPFEPGDEILVYEYEYPSNFYPWKLQEQRGANPVLIPDPSPKPKQISGSFSIEALEKLITKKTKILSISHVQFTSGFAADLEQIGRLCKEEGIDLIIDAAQSAGSVPLYPERWNIQAVATSGWKWLMGPTGSGVLYTAPEFRKKINPVMTGPTLMKQGEDYLDHRWQLHEDGRFFEYSTPPLHSAVSLGESIRLINEIGIESVYREILRLQDLFLTKIDKNLYQPVLHPQTNRSGILSFRVETDPVELSRSIGAQGVVVSSRGGFLRVAPHFYNDDEEIIKAAKVMNEIARPSG